MYILLATKTVLTKRKFLVTEMNLKNSTNLMKKLKV